MAINKESNAYTFGFAIVLVLLVGVTLAFTSMSLKDTIKKNQNDKKMMDVLASIGVEASRSTALGEFDKYVKERILIDNKGNVMETTSGTIDPLNTKDAFNLDLMKVYRSDIAKLVQGLKNDKAALMAEVDKVETNYPLYKCEKDGKSLYVMPMAGTGLWGPIWGYVAIEDDFNTIYGASFDHQGETPGLGAEIKKDIFEDKFQGLTINDDNNNFVSIAVIKGGNTPSNNHEVDGITGGTITSNGVGEMLYRSMAIYNRYFKKQ